MSNVLLEIIAVALWCGTPAPQKSEVAIESFVGPRQVLLVVDGVKVQRCREELLECLEKEKAKTVSRGADCFSRMKIVEGKK